MTVRGGGGAPRAKEGVCVAPSDCFEVRTISEEAAQKAEVAAHLSWRLIRDEPRSGARNMAIDHALAACLDRGEAVARLYGWERPTLSFGRNEPAGAYASGGVTSGLDVVRRPTGGRAVLHHRELTYAVVAPVRALGGAREAYRRVNGALAGALRSLGAPVELAQGAGSLAPDAGPCFQAPAPGEVVARGRKLVGSAQARIGGALLQHGSILLADDQSRLGHGPISGGPISLDELIGDVSIDEVAGAVAESLASGLGGAWTAGDLSAPERDMADRLEADTYSRDSWTWRR